ncbi:Mitochondrial distribution and morphology protein 10 [Cladophialophora carrionii]|uniref:Mitochondrial distribution and morphology protein 10 n=1 Tax=Cladophialophora carrionii TaxID=86049 RepID=A0A1C1C9S6_9EURO|nr:Mitochondrial distribution and morphology protein 10 [Cladophialophora carrionii]
MIDFMDYIVHAFGTSTDWNPDNSYSSLTATSDALLSFQTPSTLSLHISSLSTPNFASSYTLSTLGQIDGSISYLYSSVALGHVPSEAPTIPLKSLTKGYREVRLPVPVVQGDTDRRKYFTEDGRKPILLHATLALPPPSVLTALYARRISPETLLSLSLYSQSTTKPTVNSGPPPASVLAHLQHDNGQYSVEGLGSTDNGLLGVRGLWNFGVGPLKQRDNVPSLSTPRQEVTDGAGSGTEDPSPRTLSLPSQTDSLTAYRNRLASKPSLLSAGAEFYYSPFSHVIGLSTGLRFTTLAPHITPSEPPAPHQTALTGKPVAGTSASLLSTAGHTLLTPSNVPHSSFPYTMTLTATPLTGSISSTYSVRPTPYLALSSRFDFNFYSWESRYVVGGELWRPRKREALSDPETDPVHWARTLTSDWFSPAERALKTSRLEREEENVLKFRVDDTWNVKALWTGRVKSLLVEVGVSVNPVAYHPGASMVSAAANSGSETVEPASLEGNGVGMATGNGGGIKRWTGNVGVSIAYST